MLLILIMNFSLSIFLISLSHPLSMGFILLIQTILISLLTGMLNINFWFSYILFLIMVGGMLVLFIYMTSIASNEMFKFKMNLFIFFIFLNLVCFSMFFIDSMMLFMNFFSNFNYSMNFKFNLNKFFSPPNNIILLTMIIYLFITLIAIVKITDLKYGPLRQKY